MMTDRAAHASEAFRAGRRRRAAHATVEQTVDGVIAGGGLLIANAAFGIGLGLPEGGAGISLGLGLISAGMAWMTRRRRRDARPLYEAATSAAMRAPVPTVRAISRAA